MHEAQKSPAHRFAKEPTMRLQLFKSTWLYSTDFHKK